ncbi:MAG TPA: hypothetical protein VME46_20215 [Acidimicrobiales bacterium]|nr:hypothetical protein [Acidimicrobiales bacterium]
MLALKVVEVVLVLVVLVLVVDELVVGTVVVVVVPGWPWWRTRTCTHSHRLVTRQPQ